MRKTLFISDLHLHPSQPEIEEAFLQFLKQDAPNADALYILGDLFEFWMGDDDINSPYQNVLHALKETSRDLPVYFMPGNRDFLVGSDFETITGCQIISDGLIIDLYDQQAILLHGDTLCTDDVEYQKFRKEVRSAEWKNNVLSMSLGDRHQYFVSLRQQSQSAIEQKSSEIMDVNSDAVISTIKSTKVDLMIHGHTHRPGTHSYNINNKDVKRIVLGDWYDQGSMLICTDNGQCDLQSISYN